MRLTHRTQGSGRKETELVSSEYQYEFVRPIRILELERSHSTTRGSHASADAGRVHWPGTFGRAGKRLRTQMERDDIGSPIFWGPPGTGKTMLAKIIAGMTKADFIEFSAVLTGIREIKQIMADAERGRRMVCAPLSLLTRSTALTKRNSTLPAAR